MGEKRVPRPDASRVKEIARRAKLDISKFDTHQLLRGFEVEREHDDDSDVDVVKGSPAKREVQLLKIAVAHLREKPDYYTRLKKVEECARADELIVEALKSRNLDLPYATADEGGVRFETGQPVTFRFTRNTEKAPNMGEMFGQHLEPAGRYMLHHSDEDYQGDPPRGWERGTHSFENPLVIEWGTTSGEPHGWKARVSKAFGGRTGKRLTRALLRHGHDGIVTVQKHKGRSITSEIMSLRI